MMTQRLSRPKINPVLSAALAECKPHFISAAVFSALINVLQLAPTLYMLQVYSRVLSTGATLTLIYLTLILTLALGTLSFLDSLRARLLMRSGLRIDKILAKHVLNQMYARGGSRRGQGSLLLREFDTFKQVLGGQGIVALFDLPWIVIFLGLCFYLNPWLGWLTVMAGLTLAAVTWLSERSSYKYVTQSAEAMAKAYARQDATSQLSDVVRALGMRRALVQVQLNERHSAMDVQIKASLSVNGFSTLSKFLHQFFQSVSLGVGAYLAIRLEISVGAVFAASLLMFRALTPMEQVINSWRSLIRGYNAFKMVDNALNDQDAQLSLTRLPAPKAVIDVDGLSVTRPEMKAYILQDISFKVLPGELVGIAGASGAGKSTLARALVGSERYEIGTIRFDGAERRDWDPEVLAQHVSYLPQENSLFAGSVRDNISRFETANGGSGEEIDAEVIKAARAAGLHELILQLPHGYNTGLGLNGQGLSGGQAQRVALARALYREPGILILDEPNAYQDGAGEVALIKAMSDVCTRGGAVVVIAHRASVLERVDKLLILNGGRVQFFGTPREWADVISRQRAGGAKLAEVPNIPDKASEAGSTSAKDK